MPPSQKTTSPPSWLTYPTQKKPQKPVKRQKMTRSSDESDAGLELLLHCHVEKGWGDGRGWLPSRPRLRESSETECGTSSGSTPLPSPITWGESRARKIPSSTFALIEFNGETNGELRVSDGPTWSTPLDSAKPRSGTQARDPTDPTFAASLSSTTDDRSWEDGSVIRFDDSPRGLEAGKGEDESSPSCRPRLLSADDAACWFGTSASTPLGIWIVRRGRLFVYLTDLVNQASSRGLSDPYP